MIKQEKALKIVRKFIKYFEDSNIESQSGMLASGNYAELLYLRDLESWVAAQHSVQRTVEACAVDRHDYYKALLDYAYCPYCGERLHSR